MNNLKEKIHQRAVEISIHYKKTEAELIEILQEVEIQKVFLEKGYSSLFLYVVRELKLSESVAYNLITISRKAREVPELKCEIAKGAITLSNARKIVSILNSENKEEWLKKASELSQRALEKEVVKVRPKEATKERTTYVTKDRVKLELGLFEKDMLRLRRVQDIMSGKKRRPVMLEEMIIEMTENYLNSNDPLRKAKRVYVKKGFESPTETIKTPVSLQVDQIQINKRVPIPAATVHLVNLRDQRMCTYMNKKRERCNQARWLEIHHVNPVSSGGKNTVNNLTTLCQAHHGYIHEKMIN